MNTFSNIFHSTFCRDRQYLNIFYISFIFYCWQQVLFKLRVSSLLSTLNDASVDIVDDEDSFQFSSEAELHYPYTFTSPLQKTQNQNHCAWHDYYSLKNMLKLLAFRWLLNELLLET